jgi:hypothetical protein
MNGGSPGSGDGGAPAISMGRPLNRRAARRHHGSVEIFYSEQRALPEVSFKCTAMNGIVFWPETCVDGSEGVAATDICRYADETRVRVLLSLVCEIYPGRSDCEGPSMARLFRRCGAATVLASGLIGSAQAGLIASVTTLSLPGSSTGTIGPVGVTVAPNNDNATASSPSTLPYNIFFNTLGPLLVEFATSNSGGTTEYTLTQTFNDNTGHAWSGFVFELRQTPIASTQAMPQPSSLLLLGAGILALISWRRRA